MNNLEASPVVKESPLGVSGKIRWEYLSFTLAQNSFSSAGDTFRLFRVPAQIYPVNLSIASERYDLGGTQITEFGIYEAGGVAKDDNRFLPNSFVLRNGTVETDLFRTSLSSVMQIGLPLWHWAGDAADPGIGVFYDIVMTNLDLSVISQAANVIVKFLYTAD